MKPWLLTMLLGTSLLAEWLMFTDGVDTYIYSERTGEIFIRTSMGGKNYEDRFVKMPRGVLPEEIKNQENRLKLAPASSGASSSKNPEEDTRALQQKALEATQKMYENVLQ